MSMPSERDRLLAKLRDPDHVVRMFAAYALGDLGEGQQHPDIGGWTVWSGHGYLRVGWKAHTFAYWIEHAEEIYIRRGCHGLSDQTRALAQKLLAEQESA